MPLNAVAVAAMVVALTCLTTLVVVASIKDVDTLSTVALALAIIAFVAQLIVFVVQTSTSNAQMLQSHVLHAELLRLLGTIDERARGTDAAVSKMSERLLEAALGKVIPSSGGLSLGATEIRRLARDISEVLDGSASERGTPPEAPGTGGGAYRDDGIVQMLQTFPDEAAAESGIAALEELDPVARALLKRFAKDEIETRSPNADMGPGLSQVWPGSDALLEAGLIERDPEGFSLNVLTPKGRTVGRLLTASGPVPPAIADALAELRDTPADE